MQEKCYLGTVLLCMQGDATTSLKAFPNSLIHIDSYAKHWHEDMGEPSASCTQHYNQQKPAAPREQKHAAWQRLLTDY